MKNLLIVLGVIFASAACNSGTQTKEEVKNDTTILTAPESNSNMTDTRAIFTDSSRVDSGKGGSDSVVSR